MPNAMWCVDSWVSIFPAGNYMFKVNNTNSRTRCEICSKLTIKTPERRHWHRSGVFIVNFEHILQLVLVFLLLTLSRSMPAGFALFNPFRNTGRAFSRTLLSTTVAPNLMSRVFKKTFSSEMFKNKFCLVGTNKCSFLQKKCTTVTQPYPQCLE